MVLTSVEVLKRRADALRGLWIVLILIYTALVVTNQISGTATMVYVGVTCACIFGDGALRRRIAQRA